MDSLDIRQFLSRPDSYPGTYESVEMIETHISWVFLVQDFVFKMKKPVKFDFLDFSTFEKRLEACKQELILNKRMAPSTYLDVVFVTRDSSGSLGLSGPGVPIEPLVKMRRLPSESMLDWLLMEEKLQNEQLLDLSNYLNDFYSHQPAVPCNYTKFIADVTSHIMQNRTALLENTENHCHDKIKAIHTAQLIFLHVHQVLFKQRISDGRIIDGHGDLRPEHICFLDDGPAVFDCIEFNPEFRLVDIIDELAFLAIEMERLGHKTSGELILENYMKMSEDRPDPRLPEFYKSYRAIVRAKVAAIRSGQVGKDLESDQKNLADAYIDIASHYASQLEPIWIFAVGGGMGAGKSTLATALAAKYQIEILQTDVIRRELCGKSEKDHSFGEGLYTEENRNRIYQEMLHRLEQLLDRGLSVVLDASFGSELIRNQVTKIADKYSARLSFLWCHCSPEVAKKRIEQRLIHDVNTSSEARPDLVDSHLKRNLVPSDRSVIKIDTTKGLEDELEQLSLQISRSEKISPSYEGVSHEP